MDGTARMDGQPMAFRTSAHIATTLAICSCSGAGWPVQAWPFSRVGSSCGMSRDRRPRATSSTISAEPGAEMEIDLLVFGPHPDDIEIGIGGTVAKHAALGHQVGLCDLTRGEMASNGTPDERLAEAEAARIVLGAAWRENLGWPDRAIGGDDHVRQAARLIRRVRPRVIAIPYWNDRHPDHGAASRVLSEA